MPTLPGGFGHSQNLKVEWRAHGLHPDLISQYAAELIEARVEVITVGGDLAIRAAQQATKTEVPRSPISLSNTRTKFELWIKPAKAMGVTVPEGLLVRAER
jgi:hypothetical protein